jgi:prepilin-type N-terminal cleavage/methylation domain-containing protein
VDGQRGFTLVELMVIIAIIGIISTMATPLFMTFLRAMETRGASQELATLLNQAKQLAISTNCPYRLEIDTVNNQLRFASKKDPITGVCTTNTWTGEGYRRLENQARLSNTNRPSYAFNHLGTTPDTGTITVQDSKSNSSLNVVISSMGRIRICPPNCP